MIGLMYKDLVIAAKQLKIAFIIVVFYAVFTFYSGNILMFGYMTALLCIMLPISSMAFDERSNWNKYALTMPVTCKQLVYSKYILSLIFTAVTTILFFVLTLFIEKGVSFKQLQIIVCIISFTILFTSIYLACAFKFGTEKSRFVIFGVFGAITIGILACSKMNIPAPSQATIQGLINIAPLIALFFFIVSIMISVNVMQKKEY